MFLKGGRSVASIKVLVELFQKLAGFEGAEPLIDLRRGRNSQDIRKSSFFRFLFSSLKEKRKKRTICIRKMAVAFRDFSLSATAPSASPKVNAVAVLTIRSELYSAISLITVSIGSQFSGNVIS